MAALTNSLRRAVPSAIFCLISGGRLAGSVALISFQASNCLSSASISGVLISETVSSSRRSLATNSRRLAREVLRERKTSGVGIEGTVGTIHAGKDGLEVVILLLLDGIEFVIVAAGAMGRDADEGGHGGGDHVVAIESAGHVFVGGAFAEFGLADEIPRAGGDEAEGDGGLGSSG